LGTKTVALYDIQPVGEGAGPERKSIVRLTFEAASVLGSSAKVLWGLEAGRWHLVSFRECDTE